VYVVLLFSNEHFTWSQKLYVAAGESLTMMPTAHVYAGADVEVAAPGT